MFPKSEYALHCRRLNGTAVIYGSTTSATPAATRFVATTMADRQCSVGYHLAGSAQTHRNAPGDEVFAHVVDAAPSAIDINVLTSGSEQRTSGCRCNDFGDVSNIDSVVATEQWDTTLLANLVLQKFLNCVAITVGLYNAYPTGNTLAAPPRLSEDLVGLFSKLACSSNMTLPAAPSITTFAPAASMTAVTSGTQLGSVNRKGLISLPSLARAYLSACNLVRQHCAELPFRNAQLSTCHILSP